MLGFLVAFWATPRMTLARLVYALGMTIYILIGLRYEERDLLRTFGAAYEAYRRRVPMLIPFPRRRPAVAEPAESPSGQAPSSTI
jgi:protein-S-isoprenylcysteine O-methyltransferase Ste14